MTDDIVRMDATRIAQLIARRELSPVEVMQAHLDRIAAVNPKLNAIVTLADGAMEGAGTAEAAVISGAQLGPLHGVPFTVKDGIDTAGGMAQRGAAVFRRGGADVYVHRVAKACGGRGTLVTTAQTPQIS